MRINELEEKIYEKMKEDKGLKKKLTAEGVYHLQVPARDSYSYPCIVYSVINFAPIFYTDDDVREYLASIRIHVITKDGGYNEISEDIDRIMQSMDAKRYQTVNYREENEIILIKDYRMRLKVENEEANETISADCDCEKK